MLIIATSSSPLLSPVHIFNSIMIGGPSQPARRKQGDNENGFHPHLLHSLHLLHLFCLRKWKLTNACLLCSMLHLFNICWAETILAWWREQYSRQQIWCDILLYKVLVSVCLHFVRGLSKLMWYSLATIKTVAAKCVLYSKVNFFMFCTFYMLE